MRPDFYPLDLATLPDLITEDAEEVKKWLFLLAYCTNKEFFDGVIRECADWKEGKWHFIYGSPEIPSFESNLWEWKGNNLHVMHFNSKPLLNSKERAEKNRQNIQKRWQKHREKQTQKTEDTYDGKTIEEPVNIENGFDGNSAVIQENKTKEKEIKENKKESNPKAKSVSEVVAVMREIVPNMQEQQLAYWANQYFDSKQATDWMYQGQALHDWRANARSWFRSCLEKERPKSSREGLAPGETDRNRNIYK